MPRTLAIFGAMLCVVLGSCVSGPQTPGFAWTFQRNEGEGPKLAYGAPASDNIVLMMTCEPGSSTIDMLLQGGSPDGVVLASGNARERLRGALVASPGAGQMVEASARPDSAALAGFARTGDLSLTDRGRTVKLDASPAERRSVARFFEACRA